MLIKISGPKAKDVNLKTEIKKLMYSPNSQHRVPDFGDDPHF